MGVLQRFERRLGGLVEGAFAKVFKGGVEPVEIAGALARETDDRRAISSNRVVVPNEFAVELAGSDFSRMEPYTRPLCDELAEMVQEHALEQRYTFVGPVSVRLSEAPDLDIGVFRIRSSVRPTESGMVGGGGPARASAPGTPRLVIKSRGAPPGNEREYPLVAESTVIGRSVECDIRLNDTGVSRSHGEVRRLPDGNFLFVDAGSTNGSLVNGRAATQFKLADGDQIELGDAILTFRREDARGREPGRPGDRDAGADRSRDRLRATPAPPPPPPPDPYSRREDPRAPGPDPYRGGRPGDAARDPGRPRPDGPIPGVGSRPPRRGDPRDDAPRPDPYADRSSPRNEPYRDRPARRDSPYPDRSSPANEPYRDRPARRDSPLPDRSSPRNEPYRDRPARRDSPYPDRSSPRGEPYREPPEPRDAARGGPADGPGRRPAAPGRPGAPRDPLAARDPRPARGGRPPRDAEPDLYAGPTGGYGPPGAADAGRPGGGASRRSGAGGAGGAGRAGSGGGGRGDGRGRPGLDDIYDAETHLPSRSPAPDRARVDDRRLRPGSTGPGNA